jgi:hypothetical protein
VWASAPQHVGRELEISVSPVLHHSKNPPPAMHITHSYAGGAVMMAKTHHCPKADLIRSHHQQIMTPVKQPLSAAFIQNKKLQTIDRIHTNPDDGQQPF